MGPRFFSSLVLLALPSLLGQTRDHHQAHLEWNPATLTLIQEGGVYGRMVRLNSGAILCSFEYNGTVNVRRSEDDGRTWSDPIVVAAYPYGGAANPELLALQNGDVMLSYNERPWTSAHRFTIQTKFSGDEGRTWTTSHLIYEAGTGNGGRGCWEPSAVQLDSGEIQLFFANEKPYPATGEQEITRVRSFDNGATWTPPDRASFRIAHRDGMPVPATSEEIPLLAIEDNGIAGAIFKPAIVSGATGARWSALESGLPAYIYAGAPYLRRFPTGEMALSVQSAEGRQSPGTFDYSRMVVYLGDASGHDFTNPSEPFDVPAGTNGLWNSLFIKNSSTVTAISGTTIDGVAGLWAIDGRLVYPRDTPPGLKPLSRH